MLYSKPLEYRKVLHGTHFVLDKTLGIYKALERAAMVLLREQAEEPVLVLVSTFISKSAERNRGGDGRETEDIED